MGRRGVESNGSDCYSVTYSVTIFSFSVSVGCRLGEHWASRLSARHSAFSRSSKAGGRPLPLFKGGIDVRLSVFSALVIFQKAWWLGAISFMVLDHQLLRQKEILRFRFLISLLSLFLLSGEG